MFLPLPVAESRLEQARTRRPHLSGIVAFARFSHNVFGGQRIGGLPGASPPWTAWERRRRRVTATPDGSAGHIRPTRLTVPNSRVLRREYFARAGDDAGEPDWRLAEKCLGGDSSPLDVSQTMPNV